MPKVNSLGHVGVHVRDIERSVAFYRDILGLQVSDRSPRGGVFMDLKAATDHGLIICNAAGCNSIEVSEQAIGLLIAISRKLMSRRNRKPRPGNGAGDRAKGHA